MRNVYTLLVRNPVRDLLGDVGMGGKMHIEVGLKGVYDMNLSIM
jgi:hypothetical protein